MADGSADRNDSLTAEDLDRLALRVQGGDHEAFLELVRATERDLRIFITLYASNLAMVDEVLQAAYVTTFQRISAYEARGTLRAWMKGIARNRLMKELEERARMHALDGDILEELLASSGRRRIDDDEHDADPELRLRSLQACLLQLSPDAKRLVHERYYQDRPLGEIAELFAKSQSWVAVTLFRIRKTLLTCLRQRGVA